MSELSQLLRAAIEQGATGVFQAIHDDYVLPEELLPFHFVKNFFGRHGQLPSLLTLQQSGFQLPPIHEPASYYLHKVRERFAYNSVSTDYRQIHTAMGTRNMEQVITLMRNCVHRVASSMSPQSYASIAEVANRVQSEFQAARAELGMLRGIDLGYRTVNDILGGARGGDVIVVAGRPGMGKSYVMLKMADSAWLSGRNVAFVTMEMSNDEIGMRWAAIHTGTNPEWIARGELPIWAEDTLYTALDRMRQIGAAVPLHFLSGDFNKNVKGVEDFILEHSPDILFVDAAYLLTASGKSNGYISKWENISEVVGELKRMALRYNIPIVISVQFNRNVKNAQQKELDLGDIGGSDSIPQDATAVFGLRHGAPPFESSRRYIQTLKARRGRARDFHIHFQFQPVCFDEASEDDIPAVDVSYMI